jgi:hypothetical protein
MNAPARQLDFSIVLTLMDDRGHTTECLSSWTRGQTLGRERYEVIVVASGREPEVEARARPLLTSGDRMLRFEATNELALQDFGARQARGKWLLFTEAHCVAEPDCLAELLAYLQTHEAQFAGACIRSKSDGSSHPLCRLEERWYRDGFAAWSREGDWRKVTIRGTAVRRDAYEQVGGFKSEFGCFGEILLAAELDASGYRLGYAPAAAVKHYNSTSLHEVLAYIREYRAGEVAYQSQCSDEQSEAYFGGTHTWDKAGAAERELALRCAVSSLFHAIAHPFRAGSAAMACTMLEVLSRWALDAVSAGRAELIRASAACAWARGLFAWPWSDGDERYRRFCRLWEVTGDLARQRALYRRKSSAEAQDRTVPSQRFEYRPGGEPAGGLIGFHARETFDGQPFRWSSPLALVRVAMPPGDYEVRLDTKDIRNCQRPGLLGIYLNGRRMPPVEGCMAGQIAFRAEHTMFRVGAPQFVVLTSGRICTVGSAERRALGVPVFAIRFVPLERKVVVSEIGGS